MRNARGARSPLRSPHPPPPLPPFWTAPPLVHSVCTSVCAGCTAHPHRGGCGQHGRHGLRRSPPPPRGDPPKGRQLNVPGGPRRRTAVQRPATAAPRRASDGCAEGVLLRDASIFTYQPQQHIRGSPPASADRPGGRHRCPAIRVGQSGGGALHATVPERWCGTVPTVRRKRAMGPRFHRHRVVVVAGHKHPHLLPSWRIRTSWRAVAGIPNM